MLWCLSLQTSNINNTCHCEEGAGATDEAISGYLEITRKLKNSILPQINIK